MTPATAVGLPELTYAGRRFVHVADGVVRRMTEAEQDALSESIGTYGILQQLYITEDGRVADGWNRLVLAADLGLPWSRIEGLIAWMPPTLTDEVLCALSYDLNHKRRHLDAQERRLEVGRRRQRGQSTRAIAGALGVDQATVVGDLGSSTDENSSVERVTGRDGKSRPARMPTPDEVAARRAEVAAARDRNPGMTVAELAARLGVSTGTVSDDLQAVRLAAELADADAAQSEEDAARRAAAPAGPHDPPESSVLRQCRELLAWRKVLFLRLNAGALYDRKGRLVRLCPAGTADLLVLPPGGRAAFVETKAKTGRQREAQQAFEANVTGAGYPYHLVRDVRELEALLDDVGA